MLRFDTQNASKPRRRPPAYLSRGQQLRMLTLVVGLAFVLVAMNHLRQPEGVAAVDRLLHGVPQAKTVDEAYLKSAPIVSADLLATIDDNTFFRKQETDAWFAMFDYVRNLDPAELRATAPGPLSYAQLVQQPHVYRGRPVRFAGVIRQVERVPPGENDLGIKDLYRLILQGRGGEAWPITLYALEAPAGIELGATVELPAEVSGVFFKNWSYRHEGGLGISPVVVTNAVTAIASAPTTRTKATYPAWQVFAAAGGIAAVLLLVVRWRTLPNRETSTPETDLDFSQLSSGAND